MVEGGRGSGMGGSGMSGKMREEVVGDVDIRLSGFEMGTREDPVVID